MSKISSIRKGLAFILLVVFALSVTPKVVFHEALADHKDGLVCQDTDKSVPHYHQPAFHCSFDDLVVSSPFLSFEVKGIPEPLTFCSDIVFYSIASNISTIFLHQESRGPPLM